MYSINWPYSSEVWVIMRPKALKENKRTLFASRFSSYLLILYIQKLISEFNTLKLLLLFFNISQFS